MLSNIFLLTLIVLASANPGTYLRIYVVSDTNTAVVGPNVVGISSATVSIGNSGWTANIPGALWIWDKANAGGTDTVVFTNDFGVTGMPLSVLLNLAADNDVFTYINGRNANCSKLNNSYQLATQLTCDVTPYVQEGLNVITFRVINAGGPGGLLYKLTIDSFVSY